MPSVAFPGQICRLLINCVPGFNFYVTNSVTTFSLRAISAFHVQNLSPHQNQQVYLLLLVLTMIIIDNYLGPTNLRPQYIALRAIR